MRSVFVLLTVAAFVLWPEVALGAAAAWVIRNFME